MAHEIVDAHQHFWELGRFNYFWMTPERQVLRRNFLPSDLKPLLRENGVSATIAVQAHASREETRWLLELAATNAFIAGVVGWLDLTDPKLGADLDAIQRHPKFKGVRHPLEAESDDAWMLRPAVVQGLGELQHRGLPFDLVIFPRHLKFIPRLRELCPTLRLVIDHVAKPPILQRTADEWGRHIEGVAQLPGVWCKLSGLITEADHQRWTPDDLRPYVNHVVRLFGYDRLMFGSDWPVCVLAGSYEQVLSSTREALGELNQDDADRIWGGTARTFYGF